MYYLPNTTTFLDKRKDSSPHKCEETEGGTGVWPAYLMRRGSKPVGGETLNGFTKLTLLNYLTSATDIQGMGGLHSGGGTDPG